LGFFNLGVQEMIILLGLGVVGAVVVGIVVFLTTRNRKDRDD